MNAKFEYLLRLGDNCLVLSQQLSAWCGHGPALEEDLALTNTALDLLGQARLWLSYAGEVEGAGRDEDALAYHRDAPEFRNLLIVEQPNGHYGNTMARQFLFDVWHQALLTGLCQSGDTRIADIAQKSVKEVRYHVERSAGLMVALGDGTALSRERMQSAINKLWPYAHEWFESDAVDEQCAQNGLCPAASSLTEGWHASVKAVHERATLTVPDFVGHQKGGKRGLHTEHLSHLLAPMQVLQRTHPGAQW
ncbi:MAG: 1,2-phenylacetyl-CoA epoxidase subunit PaaC [Polaromonas sp.]